jgi:hypothetical protein
MMRRIGRMMMMMRRLEADDDLRRLILTNESVRSDTFRYYKIFVYIGLF